jgi:hypothetical protein
LDSNENSNEIAYRNFIDTFLAYQRLFDYSGSINEILDLPYCLYNDIILSQINLKKKEAHEQEKRLKQNNANRSGNFRRR